MASANLVILVGNLGRDPELRHFPSGDAVTNITVATTDQWKDKAGAKQERTEWHRVVFFGRQAEVAHEYLKKGSQVYIEGSLRTRKWTDQAGVERYTTEIIANKMQMLGKKGDTAAAGAGAATPAAPAAQGKPAASVKTGAQMAAEMHGDVEPPEPPGTAQLDNFEDIPF